jgi:hypothetical protein
VIPEIVILRGEDSVPRAWKPWRPPSTTTATASLHSSSGLSPLRLATPASPSHRAQPASVPSSRLPVASSARMPLRLQSQSSCPQRRRRRRTRTPGSSW